MVIMSFKTKKDVDHLLDKAYAIKEEAHKMIECLEEAIDDMENHEENYRHDDYNEEYRKSRYNYRKR